MTDSTAAGPAIRVLSAGAPQTGLAGCIDTFMGATGRRVEAEFATAPQIRERMMQDTFEIDVVVAPDRVVAELAARGRLAGGRARVGDVTAGVVVRKGAPHPDISSADALKRAILAAEAVVYNEASSGQYIRTMMQRLGIAEAVEGKTIRVPSAGAVMIHLAGSGTGREIGFGQVPAILRLADRGVELVGPLPEPLRHVTAYSAALVKDAHHGAQDLIAFLDGAEARRILDAAGVT